MNAHIDHARSLSDSALLERVQDLAVHERGTLVELIAHLTEVDTRGLHLKSGYGSLYAYCRGALSLSEFEAYSRIEAARAALRFPGILERLADGALNLTTMTLLTRHLTAENHLELLESARGRSKSEVKKIVARLAPKPDVATSVRKVPAPRSAPSPIDAPSPEAAPTALAVPMAPADAPRGSTAQDVGVLGWPTEAAVSNATATPADPFRSVALPTTATIARTESRRAAVDALSPDRYKLQLTIDGDTLEMLRLAQDMGRHTNPSGDESQILKSALALLVEHLAKTKFAATDDPRPARGVEPDSRHVPAAVKRTVWVRDRGRCAFISDNGHRCEERAFLEFHHVHPYAEGGPPTVENIALRCRMHNRYEWELRSTHVRRQEEEWLYRQLSAGVAPRTDTRARSGPSPNSAGQRGCARAPVDPHGGPWMNDRGSRG